MNVLTKEPKISDIIKRDIFQLNFLKSDGQYDKTTVVQIAAVFGTL